ncbi:MAG: c-type cytochrome [Acidobacteriota bacterium]
MLRKRRLLAGTLVVVIVLAALLGGLAWWKLFREVPQELADDSMEEYFKYGSIGTEQEAGIPYWIWLVLPQMFPEYLPEPGGWAALGFPWEQGREVPVGFSQKTIGFERVGLNCAFCHTTAVRTPGDPVPRLYPGGPGNTVDVLAYQRFLFRCAEDPRFNADEILAQIGAVYEMSFLDRLLYRHVLIPQTRKALREQSREFEWTDSRPDWGRGRIDPFNPVKVSLLDVDPGDTIGNSDMQAVWNLQPRMARSMAFHWDGLNTELREVVLSSALGDGAVPDSLPMARLENLEAWLQGLPAPRFDELFDVDRELAAAGEPVFREHCARCHAMDGEETGQVLPLTAEAWAVEGVTAEGPLWTDPHRAEMWTPEAAQAYNDYTRGYPWRFDSFRSTGGYVNVPLDAVWIKAPYLHNGSVPYLDELLEPPAQRTRLFYRGYDLYDPERMGFVSEGPEAERVGTRYDVSEPGNSNQGHLFGTQLSAEEKEALIEYLKTL